jgi:hypothetical protein
MSDDSGQNLAEYAIALAIVGIAAVLGALAVGRGTGAIWQRTDSVVENVVVQESGGHGPHGSHGHHRGGAP